MKPYFAFVVVVECCLDLQQVAAPTSKLISAPAAPTALESGGGHYGRKLLLAEGPVTCI
jgi:hypothetical protein